MTSPFQVIISCGLWVKTLAYAGWLGWSLPDCNKTVAAGTFFYQKSTTGTTKAAVEVNTVTYCLRKTNRKVPAGYQENEFLSHAWISKSQIFKNNLYRHGTLADVLEISMIFSKWEYSKEYVTFPKPYYILKKISKNIFHLEPNT